MLAQFEAWGYSNGADGKPDSPDDIELGLVDAAWSMEEYAATYDDDDIKFVGDVERSDGPLHAEHRRTESGAQRAAQQHRRRVGGREGTPATRSAGKPAATLRARAHLLVTVPLYMRFDPTVRPQ